MTKRRTVAANRRAAKKQVQQENAKRGRYPDWLWNEMRDLYEGPVDYTQRDLSAFAKAKGFNVSQPTICTRIASEGWVRGSKVAQLREEMEEALQDRFGKPIRDMLQRHQAAAIVAQNTAARHLQLAMNKMQKDPDHAMPVNTMRTVIAALDQAQLMEARAIGWDYRAGMPFAHQQNDADEGAVAAPRMVIAEMTASEIEATQAAAEAEHKGEFDGLGEVEEPTADEAED